MPRCSWRDHPWWAPYLYLPIPFQPLQQPLPLQDLLATRLLNAGDALSAHDFLAEARAAGQRRGPRSPLLDALRPGLETEV